MIQLNQSYSVLFAVTSAGVGTAADSTPTAVLYRNGSASGVTVTVSTTAQTGLYKATFTTDSGWSAADHLELYATATIGGTSGYLAKVWSSTEYASTFAAGQQVDLVNAPNATAVAAIQSGLLTNSDFNLRTLPSGDYARQQSVNTIGADFLSTTLTKGSPDTIERAFWQISKTQTSTDGEVAGTPTISAFDTNLIGASGLYNHQLLVFTSGGISGEARPIKTFNNTNGHIILQESLTTSPSASDEFIILPYHVHPIDEIQSGLSTLSSGEVQDIVDAAKYEVLSSGLTQPDITSSLQNYGVSTFNSELDRVSISGNIDTLDDLSLNISNSLGSGVVVSGVTSDAVSDIFEGYSLTESYAATGTEGTPAQLLYAIQQVFSEFGISGTTVTVKKLDGSTAMTFTLDDDTTPTSRTRAT